MAISHAWNNAAFTGAAMAGKLKTLDHYRTPKIQTPSDVVAMLRAMGAGSDMKIERIAND